MSSSTTTDSRVSLNIAIIGAGVAGLAAGLALARTNKQHTITIYESNSELSEFGAGIQISPNGSRILRAWNLEDAFKDVANEPEVMRIFRWQDNSLLGEIPHNPHNEWKYGGPAWQVYRPDLQRLLYEGAVAEAVKVVFGRPVENVDTENGILAFSSLENNSDTKRGQREAKADLIIAADGIRSRSRAFLPYTKHVHPTPYKEHTYRSVIPASVMNTDPVTAELMTGKVSMAWVGPNTAVLGYRVAGGRFYNFLISVPRPNPEAPVARWNEPGDTAEMRALLDGWDPQVQAVASKVEDCAAWTLAEVEKLESYVSDSGRFALVGDAAHAILPHAGQGGNMALEDAASLAIFIDSLKRPSDLSRTMKTWFHFRQDRIERLRKMATGNAGALTLPDGPAQQGRDRALAAQMHDAREESERLGAEDLKAKLIAERAEPDPNGENLLAPGAQAYIYAYDVFHESRRCVAAELS